MNYNIKYEHFLAVVKLVKKNLPETASWLLTEKCQPKNDALPATELIDAIKLLKPPVDSWAYVGNFNSKSIYIDSLPSYDKLIADVEKINLEVSKTSGEHTPMDIPLAGHNIGDSSLDLYQVVLLNQHSEEFYYKITEAKFIKVLELIEINGCLNQYDLYIKWYNEYSGIKYWTSEKHNQLDEYSGTKYWTSEKHDSLEAELSKYMNQATSAIESPDSVKAHAVKIFNQHGIYVGEPDLSALTYKDTAPMLHRTLEVTFKIDVDAKNNYTGKTFAKILAEALHGAEVSKDGAIFNITGVTPVKSKFLIQEAED